MGKYHVFLVTITFFMQFYDKKLFVSRIICPTCSSTLYLFSNVSHKSYNEVCGYLHTCSWIPKMNLKAEYKNFYFLRTKSLKDYQIGYIWKSLFFIMYIRLTKSWNVYSRWVSILRINTTQCQLWTSNYLHFIKKHLKDNINGKNHEKINWFLGFLLSFHDLQKSSYSKIMPTLVTSSS